MEVVATIQARIGQVPEFASRIDVSFMAREWNTVHGASARSEGLEGHTLRFARLACSKNSLTAYHELLEPTRISSRRLSAELG
jgi:hypothetical protein